MKHIKNNQGLTLIEVLATITILFIIGGMVYAMLFQMFANFSSTDKRISARQEANLILAHLTTIHQTSKDYKIEYLDKNYLKSTTDNGNTMVLGYRNYEYELKIAGQTLSETKPIEIDLTDTNLKEIKVDLTLYNEHDEVNITTTISRLTKAKGDED